ncbi:NUDIX domain-containing protein [Deinococcus hopiensis]|uniref:8-oxo-dGTP diphosphatase n=1 Tax=Deinococcus hopiensis KR-140 TaxID=695939 RepID=A0A1W1VAH9_9DEIO|nr:NUDIX domain-containing protein [Deinococcus hopiensis]SMB90051.1 8-oxo-dGTP diphosphatase [Deinococcus hopiensis KR-140]
MTPDRSFHLVAWAILLDSAGRILLGRRSGVSYGNGLWGLPGGHVEPGEGLAEAAVREALEEVGVRVKPAALRALGVSRYDLGGVQGADFFFVAAQWEGAPQPLAGTSEVGWFALDALPQDVLLWLPAVLEAHLLGGARVSEQVNGLELLRVYGER